MNVSTRYVTRSLEDYSSSKLEFQCATEKCLSFWASHGLRDSKLIHNFSCLLVHG